MLPWSSCGWPLFRTRITTCVTLIELRLALISYQDHHMSQPRTRCSPMAASVLGSWGNAMRGAVRNKERWKGAQVRLPKILVLIIHGPHRSVSKFMAQVGISEFPNCKAWYEKKTRV